MFYITSIYRQWSDGEGVAPPVVVTVDMGGGRLVRYPRGAPLVLPADIYPQVEPAPEPIVAVARSSGAVLVGRARLLLSLPASAKSANAGLHGLAKVEHDSFPISVTARSAHAKSRESAALALCVRGVARSAQAAQSSLAKVEHDPELAEFMKLVLTIAEQTEEEALA